MEKRKSANMFYDTLVPFAERRITTMQTKRKLMAYALSFTLLFGMMPIAEVSAAKKVSLGSKKITVMEGESKTLKVKNAKKKVIWKILSGKGCITLKKKGKAAVSVKGKKKGTSKVQATIGKTKLTCKVTVKGVINIPSPDIINSAVPSISAKPVSSTLPPTGTQTPKVTSSATMMTEPPTTTENPMETIEVPEGTGKPSVPPAGTQPPTIKPTVTTVPPMGTQTPTVTAKPPIYSSETPEPFFYIGLNYVSKDWRETTPFQVDEMEKENVMWVAEDGEYAISYTALSDSDDIEFLILATDLRNGSFSDRFNIMATKMTVGDKGYALNTDEGNLMFTDGNVEEGCLRYNIRNPYNYKVYRDKIKEGESEGVFILDENGDTIPCDNILDENGRSAVVPVKAGDRITVIFKVEEMGIYGSEETKKPESSAHPTAGDTNKPIETTEPPADTQTPSTSAPTAIGTAKPTVVEDEQDVAALKELIAEQRERGATVSEDIDSDEYEWENGRLVGIRWTGYRYNSETGTFVGKNLKGDISFSPFTALKSLVFANSDNKITSLDVTKNVNLEQLICPDNQLTSLNVAKNVNLEWLDCSYNQLTSLNVENKLEHLDCHSNQLSSLDVTKNVNLTSLDCDNNRLSSLDVTKNVNLTSLNCYNNQLSSLDVAKNVNLTRLDCSNNDLSSLDVAKNVNLTSLDCYNNQLSSLDVTKNVNLTSLNCYNNQLSSLDVAKNVNLTRLDCGNNDLSSLDVTKNVNLEYLYCQLTQLTSLNVTKNVNLEYLYCYGDQLISLNVTKNIKLKRLGCDQNQLGSLNVTENVNLEYLLCAGTKLTSLDVSNNVNLIYLDCHYNQLRSLDVSKNVNLTELKCDDTVTVIGFN